MTNRTVWIAEYTTWNRWHTCINVTISTLLKKIKLDNVDSMLSSNTDGVGNTTSWMYCTRYVWWIFARSSGLEMGMTSLNLKQTKKFIRQESSYNAVIYLNLSVPVVHRNQPNGEVVYKWQILCNHHEFLHGMYSM